MRVAVVQNIGNSPLGQVGRALDEVGAEVTLFQPYLNGDLPAGETFDALVVLGGEQTALDDDLYPYFPTLLNTMRSYVDADKPLLGICLGAQLLARALGGTNLLGSATELGWHRLHVTDEGRFDPVIGAAGASFLSFQWHADSFTLPDSATLLAKGERVVPQAFRIGRAAYGTQFHFEANRDVVAEWTRAFPQSAEKMQPGWCADHPALAEVSGAAADLAGLALARAWVALI